MTGLYAEKTAKRSFNGAADEAMGNTKGSFLPFALGAAVVGIAGYFGGLFVLAGSGVAIAGGVAFSSFRDEETKKIVASVCGIVYLAMGASLFSTPPEENIDKKLEKQVQEQIAAGRTLAFAEKAFSRDPRWGWERVEGVRSYSMDVTGQKDGDLFVSIVRNGEKSQGVYRICTPAERKSGYPALMRLSL